VIATSPLRAKSAASTTVNASRVFNFDAEIGTLKPGAEADVSVLDLKDGEFTFTDSDGKTRTGRQKLEAVTTVKGGKVFEAVA
jgi:dihydroorotase